MRMCFSEGKKKKKEKTRTFHVDPDSIDTALHTLCSTISKCSFFFFLIHSFCSNYPPRYFLHNRPEEERGIRAERRRRKEKKGEKRWKQRIEKRGREKKRWEEELPENSDARALPGDDNLLFAVGPPASIHTRWALRYVHTPPRLRKRTKREPNATKESRNQESKARRGGEYGGEQWVGCWCWWSWLDRGGERLKKRNRDKGNGGDGGGRKMPKKRNENARVGVLLPADLSY